MKALILSDEINQFHWSMLKSVLLVLSILPASQGILHLWQTTEGSSQIMVGFFAISMMSTLFVLCFWSALKRLSYSLNRNRLLHLKTELYRSIAIFQCCHWRACYLIW